MSFKVTSLLISWAYVVSGALVQQNQNAQDPEVTTLPTQEKEIDYNSLGQYENIATATVEILPVLSDMFDQLTPDAAAIRSGESLDTNHLKSIVMAFIPVTKKVMIATAKSEGKDVKKEVLDRLDALEKTLPSTFDFMANVRRTDFHGIGEDYNYYTKKASSWDHEGKKIEPKPVIIPAEYNPERFSGSIVSMPNQKPFFINHPPKELYDGQ